MFNTEYINIYNKIIDCYNDEKKFNKKILENNGNMVNYQWFSKLNKFLIEIISIEIYISNKFLYIIGKNIDFNKCFNELLYRNYGYYNIINENITFFLKVYDRIKGVKKTNMGEEEVSIFKYKYFLESMEYSKSKSFEINARNKVIIVEISNINTKGLVNFLEKKNIKYKDLDYKDNKELLKIIKNSWKLFFKYNSNCKFDNLYEFKFKFTCQSEITWFLIITYSILNNKSLPVIKDDGDFEAFNFDGFVKRFLVEYNIKNFCLIFNKINSSKFNINDLNREVLKLIILLKNEDNIIQETCRIGKKGTVITNIKWKFNILYNPNYSIHFLLGLNLYPLEIINKILIGYSYSSLYKVYKKGKYQLKINSFNGIGIKNAVAQGYKININEKDINFFEKYYNHNININDILLSINIIKDEINIQKKLQHTIITGLYKEYYKYLNENITKLSSFGSDNIKLDDLKEKLENMNILLKDITYLEDSKMMEVGETSKSIRKKIALIFKKDSDELDNINISNIIFEIKENIKQLVKILKNNTKSDNKKFILFSNHKSSLKCEYDNYNKSISELSVKLTNIYNLLYISILYSYYNKRVVYYPLFLCFRGRNYSYCGSHPMNNRNTRLSIIPIKKGSNNLESSTYYNTIINIDNNRYQPFYIENKYKITEEKFKYIFNILIIEYFKFFKKDAIIDKGDGLSLEEIVESGYNYYINSIHPKFDKIDEERYFFSIKESIDSYINGGEVKDTLIIRDSTASFIQHWTYLLIPKNESVLNILNISGNKLYDFYLKNIPIIRDIYKQSLKQEDRERSEKIFDYFINRSSIKLPLMTANYEVSYLRSKSYFFDKLDSKIDEYSMNTGIEKSDIISILSNIHEIIDKYAKNDIFNEFFKINKDEYINNINRKFSYYNFNIDYSYYYLDEPKITKITKNKHTIKLTEARLRSDIDFRKTEQALKANLIHTQDAILVNYLWSQGNINLYTIHDSFAVDISQIHLLMDSVNKYFNMRLDGNNKKYSCFIII